MASESVLASLWTTYQIGKYGERSKLRGVYFKGTDVVESRSLIDAISKIKRLEPWIAQRPEDWKGVLKQLVAGGKGGGDLYEKWEQALEDNVGEANEGNVLPLVPVNLVQSTHPMKISATVCEFKGDWCASFCQGSLRWKDGERMRVYCWSKPVKPAELAGFGINLATKKFGTFRASDQDINIVKEYVG